LTLWLLDRMQQWRDNAAIVWNDRTETYGDLLDRVDGWRRTLDAHGVGPGQVVSIEADYSPSACAALLALIERNAIVVPLARAVVTQRDHFLDIAEVQEAITLDADETPTVTRRDTQVTNDITKKLLSVGNPGLVLFSSGSTGAPKASLHDFAALLEKFKVPRHRRTMMTFLLFDHIGGVNTLFYCLANGGTVVAPTRREPEAICQAIERHRVQALPTSPTFLNLLIMSEAYTRYDLSSLELITYGTEVMPEQLLKKVHEAFPKAELLQTYGLSELGILRSKSKSSDSLWVKVGGEGFETRIVDGVLWIRARSSMLGYLNAPNPFTEDGWFNTQDQVETNGEYIRILGRRSELINVGGEKVYPAEVESVLMSMPNVRDATVFGEPNPIMGHIVAARLNLREPRDPAEVRREVRAFCRGRLAPFKIPVRIDVTSEDQFSARFKKTRRS
jgi:acyl-coenzyme A synthetase/AMP-(fatty) acid ligase